LGSLHQTEPTGYLLNHIAQLEEIARKKDETVKELKDKTDSLETELGSVNQGFTDKIARLEELDRKKDETIQELKDKTDSLETELGSVNQGFTGKIANIEEKQNRTVWQRLFSSRQNVSK